MTGQILSPVSSPRAGWRGRSIVEVILVFLFFAAFARVRFALTAGALSPVAQSYISGAMLILIPVAILWLTRRDWRAYGFTLEGWRENLDIGMSAYLIRMIGGSGIGLLLYVGLSYRSLAGGLIMLALVMIEIALLGVVLRRPRSAPARAMPNLAILVGLLLLPIVVGIVTQRLTAAVVSMVVWQFIFSGFGEEAYYRGYMQSRINQEFGRPWHVFGISFGPGLLIAAFIFGLSHVLNNFNPLIGDYRLWWGWGLWTCAGGLFFGLIREKCGSLLGPGIAHGLLDAVAESLTVLFGWSL
jgi:membrane protease YdiL (CAAX protease family)